MTGSLSENLDTLKNDLEIVDAMGIYNFKFGEFLHKDQAFPEVDFLLTMSKAGCFEGTTFLYLDFENKSFFLSRYQHHLAIVCLKQQADINKVLLELKLRNFCHQNLG